MTAKNSVREVKTALAKLLATENLTVQNAYVQTASFDVKNRVLTLPIFKDTSDDETDLFIGHEVAHALWTPCDGMQELATKEKNFHSFINVTEDARIERLIQSKYPGLKKVFYNAYGSLNEKDFFGLTKVDNLDNLFFIDKLNLKAKLGTRVDFNFPEVEQEFYNRAMTTQTFDEAVTLAEEIYEYCKQEEEDKKDERQTDPNEEGQEMQIQPNDNQEDGQEDGKEKLEVTIKGAGQQNDNAGEDGQKNDDAGSKSEETEEAKEDESGQKELDFGDEGEDEQDAPETFAEQGPMSITDTASSNAIAQMVDDNLENTVDYLDIPKHIKLEDYIVPFSVVHEELLDYWKINNRRDESLTKTAKEFKTKNTKVINYLNKEFEMKKAAQTYQKSYESKTGVINTQRLYSYKYSEDIFKKATSTPEGKSHGIVFFLDWSGSMCDNLKGTMDQLLNLALFCKKSNIPFNAYAFSNEYGKQTQKTDSQSTNLYEAKLGPCTLLEMFNHKMNTRQFNKSVEIWLAVSSMFDRNRSGDFAYWGLPRKYYLSGTPLDEAIILAHKVVPAFQKSANIQIVNACFLTDGASHRVAGQFNIDPLSGQQWISDRWMSANKLYIRDKKANASIEINSEKYRSVSGRVTKALWMLLKKTTGCNLNGFFVASNRDLSYAYSNFVKAPGVEQTSLQADFDFTNFKKAMTKEKAVVAYHSGMEEMYVIKGGKALEVNDEGLEGVTAEASKAQITTAFKKMARGKLQNRVILQKFIEKIAA